MRDEKEERKKQARSNKQTCTCTSIHVQAYVLQDLVQVQAHVKVQVHVLQDLVQVQAHGFMGM